MSSTPIRMVGAIRAGELGSTGFPTGMTRFPRHRSRVWQPQAPGALSGTVKVVETLPA